MFSKILDFLNDLRPPQIFMLAGLSTILMFATAYTIFTLINKNAEDAATKHEVVLKNVVTVRADIAQNTILTEDMLQVKQVPENLVPQGAIISTGAVVGKPLGISMYAGDVLTEQKMKKENISKGFADLIPQDCRAVSVGIGNVTGVGGFAKAGDYVDVILVQKNEETANSKLILQNVLLLSINKNSVDETSTDSTDVKKSFSDTASAIKNTSVTSGNQTAKSDEPEDPTIATLALKPQQAMAVVSAAALGEIYLVLRPSNPSEMTVRETNYTLHGINNTPSPAILNSATVPPAPVTANVPPVPKVPSTNSAVPAPSVPPSPVANNQQSFELIQGDKIMDK